MAAVKVVLQGPGQNIAVNVNGWCRSKVELMDSNTASGAGCTATRLHTNQQEAVQESCRSWSLLRHLLADGDLSNYNCPIVIGTNYGWINHVGLCEYDEKFTKVVKG